MKLIKELGMIYTSQTKKYKHRFGVYECPFCEKHFKAQTTHITQGNIKSCGCLRRINNGVRTHGVANKTRLYTIWKNMRQRCTNQNNPSYKNYGGRGISICRVWDDFGEFQKWAISNGYKDELSIDRVDNNGNYEPNNCRWATSQMQSDNQRELRTTNKTGIKGLSYCKRDNLWVARVTKNNKRIRVASSRDKNKVVQSLQEWRKNNGAK